MHTNWLPGDVQAVAGVRSMGEKKLLTLFLLNWTCSIVLVSWALTNGEPFRVTFIGTETWLTLQPLLKEM